MNPATFKIVRDHRSTLLTPLTSRAVVEGDCVVGTIEQGNDGRWRIRDAGTAVEFDARERFATSTEAGSAVLAARAVSPALYVVDGLTGVERAVLDLEALTFRLAGSKDRAVFDRFGISMTRYYQVLNTLIDRGEALAYAPVTVNRLRRMRETRLARRTGMRAL